MKSKTKRKGGTSVEPWTHQENEFVTGIFYGNFWRKSKGNNQREQKQLSPAIKKKIAGMADLYLSEMEEMSRNGGAFYDPRTRFSSSSTTPAAPAFVDYRERKSMNPNYSGMQISPQIGPQMGPQFDQRMSVNPSYIGSAVTDALKEKVNAEVTNAASSYLGSFGSSVGAYLSSAAASAAAYASSAATSIATSVSAGLSGAMASASALILSTPGLVFLSAASVAALAYALYKYAKSPAAAQDRLAKSLRARIQRIEAFMKQLFNFVRSSSQKNNRDLIQASEKASADVLEIKKRIMNVPDDQEPLQATEALTTLTTIETYLGAVPDKIREMDEMEEMAYYQRQNQNQYYSPTQYRSQPPQYQSQPQQYEPQPPQYRPQPPPYSSQPPAYEQQEQSYQSQMALQEQQKQMEEQRLQEVQRQSFMDAQLKQRQDYEAYAAEMRFRNQAPLQIPQVYQQQTVAPVMNVNPLVAGVSSLNTKPLTPIFKIKAPF